MKLFTEHPAYVGETYVEHMSMAFGFGVRMVAGGFACIVHALLPAVFVKTGSRTIEALHERMIAKRHKKALPADAPLDFII